MKLQQQHNKLLFVTDTHGDLKHIQKSCSVAKNVDAIILGGDIPDHTKKNFFQVLTTVLQANVPIIVFPGSHETTAQYYETVEKISSPHLIDATKHQVIFYGEHELFFLPGSDVLSSAKKPWTGANFRVLETLATQANKKQITQRYKEIKHAKEMKFFPIPALSQLIKKKGKTTASKRLVFSHIPCKCSTKKGIDYAQFYVPKKEFTIPANEKLKFFSRMKNETFTPGRVIIPQEEIAPFLKRKYPVQKCFRNVGSEALRAFLTKHRITKFFCGHIHEAGKRALDTKEHVVRANTFVQELFLNSGEKVITQLEVQEKTIRYTFL